MFRLLSVVAVVASIVAPSTADGNQTTSLNTSSIGAAPVTEGTTVNSPTTSTSVVNSTSPAVTGTTVNSLTSATSVINTTSPAVKGTTVNSPTTSTSVVNRTSPAVKGTTVNSPTTSTSVVNRTSPAVKGTTVNSPTTSTSVANSTSPAVTGTTVNSLTSATSVVNTTSPEVTGTTVNSLTTSTPGKGQNIKSSASTDEPETAHESGTNMKPPASDKTSNETHFIIYFMVGTVLCIGCYLVYHNRNKVIILINDRRGANGSRPSAAGYQRLDTYTAEAGLKKSSGKTYLF